MVRAVAVSLLMEYDGTGTPTGKCVIDGVPFTIPVSSLPQQQATDGLTTTKLNRVIVLFMDASPSAQPASVIGGSVLSADIQDQDHVGTDVTSTVTATDASGDTGQSTGTPSGSS